MEQEQEQDAWPDWHEQEQEQKQHELQRHRLADSLLAMDQAVARLAAAGDSHLCLRKRPPVAVAVGRCLELDVPRINRAETF